MFITSFLFSDRITSTAYCLTHIRPRPLEMTAKLPPLPYTLHTRYRSKAIAWTIIIIPPIFINLGLFYGLWYGTKMDRVLGISPLPT